MLDNTCKRKKNFLKEGKIEDYNFRYGSQRNITFMSRPECHQTTLQISTGRIFQAEGKARTRSRLNEEKNNI